MPIPDVILLIVACFRVSKELLIASLSLKLVLHTQMG